MLRAHGSAIVRGLTLFFLVSMLAAFPPFAHPQQHSRAYTDPDAYAVYSAVLPHVWLWTQLDPQHVAILVVTKPHVVCIPPSAEKHSPVDSAIAQYNQINQHVWILQSHLHLDRSYTLISPGELAGIQHHEIGAWDLFFEHHSGSEGWIQLSAVGFSADKKTAVVYASYQCGLRCGGGNFYLLRKKGNQWQIADPLKNSCAAQSSDRQMTGF